MIICRTPYRLSFFGGGTDYPGWYRAHGGAVLATTINKYCYLTCRFLPPFFEHRLRIVWSKIETCASVDEIAHPAVREVLRYLKIDRGVEIHHGGDLPARSGMGSSSAFTIELLHEAWAVKRSLGTHVSNDVVDEIYEDARLAGALGGKLLGAGGGGFLLLFVPPERQVHVQERLNQLIHVPFRFEFTGSQIIF